MTKCKICKVEYTKQRMMQKCCSNECAEIFGKKVTKLEFEKKMRSDTKLRKDKLKSNSDFANEAQSAVNRYVNLRDRDIPCICCGKSPYEGVRHASHYKSRGNTA